MSGRGGHLLESMAVFALGAGLMNFFYGGATGGQAGVPGHDSFYHIKMASMIPEYGLIREFPWLRFCYFTNEGQSFVSHHYGFHMLLLPFVQLSQRLTGDALAGGRWAIATYFGIAVMLFNLLLISERIRWRWVWLILFLFLPVHFFTRHAFVRAIGTSLIFILLILLLMFRGRNVWAGLAVAAYTHLYLGGVLYAPVLVCLYTLSCVVGPAGDRQFPWRTVLWTAGGWTLGVLTYPYHDGMVDFLKLQVFGSGLSPNISVGQEWNPYSDAWSFVRMGGVVLSVWGLAVAVRFRLGPPLDAKALTLLLATFVFLLMTLKARRFIEYWPALSLLSSAFLMAPLLERWAGRACEWAAARRRRMQIGVTLLLSLGALGVAFALARRWPREANLKAMLGAWPLWTALAAAYLLTPLAQLWLDAGGRHEPKSTRMIKVLAVPLCGAIFVGCVAFLVRFGFGQRLSTAATPTWVFIWAGLATVYSIVAGIVQRGSRLGYGPGLVLQMSRAVRVVAIGVAALAGTLCFAAAPMLEIQRTSRCNYDLAVIREMMAFLTAQSEPGDVVFTDDWDIFPVFFYHNIHNHYIVGLDPKFTHERNPELWERYVKISRGQVPADTTYTRKDEGGKRVDEKIHVRLEDIRDHFGAKYVITDRDHKALAAKLSAATSLAALVYPSTSYTRSSNAPFLLFRIRDRDEGGAKASIPAPDSDGRLFLSLLTPISVEQGWGDFVSDRSVGGGPIQLGDRVYPRGLGTHAPSQLLYAIPEGYDWFEAVAGINESCAGDGTIRVSVLLDREYAFSSSELTGASPPLSIRIPLGAARELLLKADPTEDGNRLDHVDWADARFVRAPAGP